MTYAIFPGVGGGAIAGITIYPSGGPNDGPQIAAALAGFAGLGAVQLGRGTWKITTPVLVPSESTLIGGPGVIIDTTGLPTTGGPYVAAFVSPAAAPTVTTPHLLAAAPTLNSRTIQIAAGTAPVDAILQLVSGAGAGQQVQTFRVVAAAGVNLTLDEPIGFPFQIADQANELAAIPHDIVIWGNGMQVIGSGGVRFLEFASAERCTVSGITVTPTGAGMADIIFSFDSGSRDCELIDCYTDGTRATANTTMVGFALESNFRSYVTDCVTNGMGYFGINLYESIYSYARGCTILGGQFGLGLSSNGPVVSGCQYCEVDVSIIGCSASGVSITGASSYNSVTARVSSCQDAFTIGGDGSNSAYNTIGGTANGTTRYAVALGAGCVGTKAKDLVGDVGVAGTFLNLNASIDCDKVDMTAGFAAALCNVTLRARFRGCNFAKTLGAANNFFAVGSSSRADFEQCAFASTVAGANLLQVLAGSVASVATTKFTVAGGVGLYASGGTIRLGEGVDASGCATPELIGAPGMISKGSVAQVVANGATPVAVSFPDIKTTDQVVLTRLVDGGTPGIMPKVVITAGTGFTITGVALDTSTYGFIVL